MARTKKTLVLVVITGFLLLGSPVSLLAHEHQVFQIGSTKYEWTVGSLNEPISVDDKTGVDLRIESGDKGVAGLEQTLKVEIIAGDKKKVFDLSPAYNDAGAYRAPFYPTVATTYTYRFFGTIADTPVDVSFTCNPAGHPASPEDKTELKVSDQVTRVLKSGAFGCPRERTDLWFPEAASSLNEIDQRLTAISAAAETEAEDPLEDVLPGSALVIGVIGILIGLVAWRKASRQPSL